MAYECDLYEESNIAGFYWSGSCSRNNDGTYSMEEYNPDYEECYCNEYEDYTFSPSEMVDYAVSREEEYGDYAWGYDISSEEENEIRSILSINDEEEFDYYPRSLMYNLIKYADSYKDKELLAYAKTIILEGNNVSVESERKELPKLSPEEIKRRRNLILEYVKQHYHCKEGNTYISESGRSRSHYTIGDDAVSYGVISAVGGTCWSVKYADTEELTHRFWEIRSKILEDNQ